MPCYEPNNSAEIFPEWLCQAFRMLTWKEIKSIKGLHVCQGDSSAYEWYVQHLLFDIKYAENEERKQWCIDRLKELGWGV